MTHKAVNEIDLCGLFAQGKTTIKQRPEKRVSVCFLEDVNERQNTQFVQEQDGGAGDKRRAAAAAGSSGNRRILPANAAGAKRGCSFCLDEGALCGEELLCDRVTADGCARNEACVGN